MTKKQHERMARSLNKELAIILREVETLYKNLVAIDEKAESRNPPRWTEKEVDKCEEIRTKGNLYEEIGESLYQAIETLEYVTDKYFKENPKEEE